MITEDPDIIAACAALRDALANNVMCVDGKLYPLVIVCESDLRTLLSLFPSPHAARIGGAA